MNILKLKNRFDYFKTITFIIILLSIFSFFSSWFMINLKVENSNSAVTNISSIAGYLRFFTGNKIMFDIAIHNFILAFIVFILSTLSMGVFGVFPLCSAFYIAGITLKASSDIYTISFVLLEILGMSLSVFLGIYIAKKRRENHMQLKSIFLFSFCLIIILGLIYFLAGYIESGLIKDLWR